MLAKFYINSALAIKVPYFS